VSALLHPVRFVLWGLGGAAGAVALAIAIAVAFGDRPLTEMSGSMNPAIQTGDVVISKPIHPLEARPGDIVTFKDPASGGRHLITHRLRSFDVHGGTVVAVTKGDANNTVERWAAPAGARIGRVVLRVPRLGYALALSRGPFGKLLLIVIPALMLGALELVRIWRPRRTEVSPDAAAA
jgi:signal peptidase I